MPRQYAGPYLYLRPAPKNGGYATWIIRDRGKIIPCKALEEERDKAHEALRAYVNANYDGATVLDTIRGRPRETSLPNTIYFATCNVPDFPIKIGIASDVVSRMTDLQCALPYDVVVLATVPGDRSSEKVLHADFGAARLRGEWFSRSPELMAYIGRISVRRSDITEQNATKALQYAQS